MYIPSFPTYLSVYILTKSEFISSCIRPAVGLTLFKSLAQLFWKCSFFLKWPPVAILDVQISLLTISDQYHNIYFCDFFFTKWPHLVISDRYATLLFLIFLIKWLPSITFLVILDEYGKQILNFFDKMTAGVNFGCPKFTFDRISGHFRSIRNFIFFGNFWQNGCHRPFWMSEIHFRSHFWPFYINTQL